MGVLFNRLLILLDGGDPTSTYYHIALVMLRHNDELQHLSIVELAELCAVSKSTISKFIRYIGYEDYADFRYAAIIQNNKYNFDRSFIQNVMEYLDTTPLDAYVENVLADVAATYRELDWQAVDRLVQDLARYEKVGAFGLMFSQTAALDLQFKLAQNRKFVVTNLDDLKQDDFIRNAGPDTLIIVFSDSGEFINKYYYISDYIDRQAFSQTRARVVLITANRAMANDPRVAYCLFYQRTGSVSTHRIVYGLLTDIIAHKYRQYCRLAAGEAPPAVSKK